MDIERRNGLPVVSVSLSHQGQDAMLRNVLLDTGSAGTLFSADKVLGIWLKLKPNDTVHRIRGFGGTEFVEA